MNIFDYESIKNEVEKIKSKIKAEYCFVGVSTLGGKDNPSLLIRISLDKKENWTNGIYQNSRYYHFHINNNGEVENFSGSYKLPKIRKKTVKNLTEAINYINKKIQEVDNG